MISVSHKIDFRKQSLSIAMDLMYNQNAEKAAMNPDPDDTPSIIMKANPQKPNQPQEMKLYSSWLAVFPPFPVFFGRRSECRLANARNA
jgi:hypothetical protein